VALFNCTVIEVIPGGGAVGGVVHQLRFDQIRMQVRKGALHQLAQRIDLTDMGNRPVASRIAAPQPSWTACRCCRVHYGPRYGSNPLPKKFISASCRSLKLWSMVPGKGGHPSLQLATLPEPEEEKAAEGGVTSELSAAVKKRFHKRRFHHYSERNPNGRARGTASFRRQP
jgi:hypothetical protein